MPSARNPFPPIVASLDLLEGHHFTIFWNSIYLSGIEGLKISSFTYKPLYLPEISSPFPILSHRILVFESIDPNLVLPLIHQRKHTIMYISTLLPIALAALPNTVLQPNYTPSTLLPSQARHPKPTTRHLLRLHQQALHAPRPHDRLPDLRLTRLH